MSNITQFLKRHSLIAGIVLMFLFTWPIDFANAGLLPIEIPEAVALTFGWGIIFASSIITGLVLGRGAVISLLRRFLFWRVSWKWYLIAFLLYPIIFSTAVLVQAAWAMTVPDFSTVMARGIFGTSAHLPAFILPFFLFDFLTNGEEMGWRGYVLPRLQARHSALAASLIVGMVWGLWHLPRYLAPESTASFPLLMVKAMADSVIYTWLYNNTRGSLLLTAILHAAGNTAGLFLPMANTLPGADMGAYVAAVLILIAVAVVIALRTGSSGLSRTEEKQVEIRASLHAPTLPTPSLSQGIVRN